MYTLVRKEEKINGKTEYTFHVLEIPKLVGYTNYRYNTEKFDSDLDIELFIFPIMHMDMSAFSVEGQTHTL